MAKQLSFAEIKSHGNCNKDKCIDGIESALIEISRYRCEHLFNTRKRDTYSIDNINRRKAIIFIKNNTSISKLMKDGRYYATFHYFYNLVVPYIFLL